MICLLQVHRGWYSIIKIDYLGINPEGAWDDCSQLTETLHHAAGATLKCGVTLADFLYHGGTSKYPQITHTWASKKNTTTMNIARKSDEFIASSSLAPI